MSPAILRGADRAVLLTIETVPGIDYWLAC